MNPFHPLAFFPAIFLALLSTWLLSRLFRVRPEEAKYKSIDGLRGYLAFFVFLHHASIWGVFLRTQQWQEPGSNLYNQFGKSSVALFFMITGFLFFSKLAESRSKPVDWLRLFVSRVMRLTPLYFFSVLVLFLLVGIASHFKLVEPLSEVLKEAWQWLSFTVFGMPSVNSTPGMGQMNAGVTWSLIYEWVFYLLLPFFGLLFFRTRVSNFTLFLSLALAGLIFYENILPLIHIYTFGGGLAAALLVRSAKFRALAASPFSSIVVIGCLFLVVWYFNTAYEAVPLLLLSAAFILIACGNSLFGLLVLPVSRLLGRMSYPIYLLHGMVLYISFRYVTGYAFVAKLPVLQYWFLVAACAVVLVCICFAAHQLIEQPGMRATPRIAAKVRERYRRLQNFFLKPALKEE